MAAAEGTALTFKIQPCFINAVRHIIPLKKLSDSDTITNMDEKKRAPRNRTISLSGEDIKSLKKRIILRINNIYRRLIKLDSSFEHLKKFASPNCFFTSNSFKEVENLCQNIFAAE